MTIARGRTVRAAMIVLALAPGAALCAQEAQTPSPAAPQAAMPVVTLDQVIAAGSASAPGLRLASATVEAARAVLLQAQASGGLAFAGTGGYFHRGAVPGTGSSSGSSSSTTSGSNGENIQGGVTLSGPATSVGVSAVHTLGDASGSQVSAVTLSASQTIFDGYPGGRSAAAVQQAQDTYRSAQVTYDAAQKSVILSVRQAYYTLLSDQNTVLVRQASLQQAEQNLAYYQGLLTAGRATQLDVLQNQVTLTQAQLDLKSAENTVQTDRATLSAAVGWPADRVYTVADAPLPDLPTIQPDEAVRAALANRSEIRTLDLSIAAATVALALQRSQAWPVISINGSMDLTQDWTAGANAGSFTAGASVALPFLDGGLRDAQVQQAAAQLTAFRVQRDQQGQSISIAVRGAVFAVHDAWDRLDLAGQNVKAAQGQYDLQRARYGVGLVTTLDVLTAFSALTAAQVALEQARSTYALAVLGLNHAMGE